MDRTNPDKICTLNQNMYKNCCRDAFTIDPPAKQSWPGVFLQNCAKTDIELAHVNKEYCWPRAGAGLNAIFNIWPKYDTGPVQRFELKSVKSNLFKIMVW